MFESRRRASGALALMLTTTLGGSVIAASPSTAEPDIEDVQSRVDSLYREAQEASERYNQARIDLKKSRSRLGDLRGDLAQNRDRVAGARDVVAANVVAQYQGQAITTAAQLATSDDPDAFIGQLTRVSELNAQQATVAQKYSQKVDRLERREKAAARNLDRMKQARAELAEEKAVIEEKASEAEALLGRLEEREQRASRSADRTETTPAPAVSGGAGAAVQRALAQVGDSYVYGATGPDSFDCSGLTMFAWAAAGVSLPHSSSAQMSSGRSVSVSQLQPGDLVFYYSPVSHVGMYIGNGTIVHAANPSTDVATAPLHSMPVTGAVRPG